MPTKEATANKNLWEKHPELFHYTDKVGVLGILESDCLRATHWRHLNDKEEIQPFLKLLPDLLFPVFRRQYKELQKTNEVLQILHKHGANLKSAHQADAKTMAEALYSTLLRDDPENQLFDIFITSFCTPDSDYKEVRNHGLLSQWRYYGDGGYAIVFDTEKFLALMHQEQSAWDCVWSCSTVAYSSEPIENLHHRLEAFPAFKDALKNCDFQTRGSVEPILSPFLRCAVHYKHWAFSEEREVRLALVLNGEKMTKAIASEGYAAKQRARSSFQRKDGSTVPCLNVFEGLHGDQPYRLPIKRIIVGPGPGQSEREALLKAFLAKNKRAIEVTCSNIPMRF